MQSTGRPPSIGEKPNGLLRVREQRPLPDRRELILAEVGRILGLGLVQKLTVEVGQPIFFERFVHVDGEISADMEEVESLDLYGAARNAEIIDFPSDFPTPFETLFRAFHELSDRKLVPKAFLGSNWSVVRRWLKLKEHDDVGSIFGIPTYSYTVEQVPGDILMLVASDFSDADEVKLTIRIPIDFPAPPSGRKH